MVTDYTGHWTKVILNKRSLASSLQDSMHYGHFTTSLQDQPFQNCTEKTYVKFRQHFSFPKFITKHRHVQLFTNSLYTALKSTQSVRQTCEHSVDVSW